MRVKLKREGVTKMKRRSSKQLTDKKPIFNKELWREIPEGLQGKVRGGGIVIADDQLSCQFS